MMNTFAKIAIPVLILVGLFLCWRNNNLSSQLMLERERHEGTRKELRAALEENARWGAAYDAALASAEAQRGNAQACLEREARALSAAQERAAIMSKATPQARNPKDKVIDHETRARIAARLNKPL